MTTKVIAYKIRVDYQCPHCSKSTWLSLFSYDLIAEYRKITCEHCQGVCYWRLSMYKGSADQDMTNVTPKA